MLPFLSFWQTDLLNGVKWTAAFCGKTSQLTWHVCVRRRWGCLYRVCVRDCNYFLNDTKIHTLLDFCFFGFGILDFAYNFDADTVNDFADRRLAVCISQHLATTATRNANLIIIRDRGFLAPFASSAFRVASLSDSNIWMSLLYVNYRKKVFGFM